MHRALCLRFALSLPALAHDPVLPAVTAIHPLRTLGELPPPESLRPGYAVSTDLPLRALGFSLPLYQIVNVLTLNAIGSRDYTDLELAADEDLLVPCAALISQTHHPVR
ncbi:hypothetical protein BUE65_21420, partial [Klebsiella variicola]|uniref:DUF4056 domain-containing protein n=1 Tax=Klebsiella variicola TaxID=244366 RepID=UPI000B708B4E